MPKVIHTKLNFVLRRLFQREPLGLYSYLKRFKGRRSSTFNNYIRYYRNWRILGSSATLSLIVLSGLFIAPLYHQEPLGLAIGTAAETSLTLSSASSTASVSVTPSSSTGTFASSSIDNSAKFTVTSTNYTGYNLTLTPSSSNDTNQTLSSTNSDDIFTSITDTDGVSSTNFASSSYTSLNNKWGVAYGTTTTYDAFYPASSTLTVGSTTSANGSFGHPAQNDIYYIGLGVRAAQSQTATTYNNTNSSNTYILTATGNKVAYTINFSSYESDVPVSEVSNLPAALSSSTNSTSVQITNDKTPTRTGYTFKSWCLGITTNNGTTCRNTDDTAAGIEYKVGDIFPINQTTTNISTLYAVWKIDTYDVAVNFSGSGVANVSFATDGYDMEVVSVSGDKATLTYGVSYTMTMNLTDSSTYSFDSWAINNVGYGAIGSTSTNPTTFTPNENSGSAVITAIGKVNCLNTISGYMQNISSATNYCDGASGTVTDNRDNNQYKVAKLADGKVWMLDNLRLDTSIVDLTVGNTNIKENATIKAKNKTSDFDSYSEAQINTSYKTAIAGNGSIGVYYNFCAASAGTVCSISYSGNIEYDVCPSGWRLPIGGTSSEYMILYSAYSNDGIKLNSAFPIPLAGYFWFNNQKQLNEYANFLTSTSSGFYNGVFLAYYTANYSSYAIYNDYKDKAMGQSIRCLLK